MELGQLADRYLMCFHFLGQCSSKPQKSSSSKVSTNRALENLPAIILVLFIACAFVLMSYKNSLVPYDSASEMIIYNMFMGAIVLRALVPVCNAFLKRKHVQCIWKELFTIERIFREKLQQKLRLNDFNRTFFKHSSHLLLAYLAAIVVRIAHQIVVRDEEYLGERILMVLLLAGLFPVWHTIFYVNLIKNLLETLSVSSKTATKDISVSKVHFVLERLKNYKLIHFHLCKVSHFINRTFGWSWILIFLHDFTDIVLMSYMIFEQSTPKKFSWRILREYCLEVRLIGPKKSLCFRSHHWCPECHRFLQYSTECLRFVLNPSNSLKRTPCVPINLKIESTFSTENGANPQH